MHSRASIAASLVATLAFGAYTTTLLPGVDLGDTGGFQAAVLWPEISARQAYPLFYFLAGPFVGMLAPDNPARGLNLFSAVWAAVAAGLLTWVCAVVAESLAGGAVAGLLLAFSYTFWSQAVIAEVYSLHLALVGLCLVSLVVWWAKPSLGRLTLFFAVYALSFGNHLSMILLLAPFAAFLVMAHALNRVEGPALSGVEGSPRPAGLLHPRIVGLAIAIAFAGTLQYLPNLLVVWTSIDAPEQWTERLAAFWFDVTKADWRATMVMGVSPSELGDRLAMISFDARQQFGIAGLALAALGPAALWRTRRPWALLIVFAYLVNTLFSITYNVGDPHVFFLPGHYFTALSAGCTVAAIAKTLASRSQVAATLAATAALLYGGWRGYDTMPAVARHDDRRAERLATELTLGIDEADTLLVSHLNWQVENVLIYQTRYRARNVAWTRLPDVFLHFPLLVQDNHAIGRNVALTTAGAREVAGAFGPLLPLVRSDVPPAPSLAAIVDRIPRGALYVLCLLTPSRDEQLDSEAVGNALAGLSRGRAPAPEGASYEVFVGHAGESLAWHHASTRPFRHRLRLGEGELDVRMESWVPVETFRRGGFGHAILGRRRMLAIERGLSLAWLDASGAAEPFYAAGLYASQPRFYVMPPGGGQLALLH